MLWFYELKILCLTLRFCSSLIERVRSFFFSCVLYSSWNSLFRHLWYPARCRTGKSSMWVITSVVVLKAFLSWNNEIQNIMIDDEGLILGLSLVIRNQNWLWRRFEPVKARVSMEKSFPGEKGHTAYPSYTGWPNFLYISLQNVANRLKAK